MAVIAMLAAGSFLVSAGMFTRVAATAILMLTTPPTLRFAGGNIASFLDSRFSSWRDLTKQWLPYIGVTMAGLIALGPIATGQMPVSQDHVNHYFATHIFVHEMVPSFRFFGWTDQLNTGYPFGDLYHTAAYTATGLLYLLSFGSIDLEVSYAFGIVLAWLVPAWAVIAWTRRLAGPWGALLAGLFYVLDKGGDREGGFIYAMFHGVWPQQLGVGIWLFALLAYVRFVERPTTRTMAICVLVGGLGLWVHPLNALTTPLAAILLLAVLLLKPPADREKNQGRGVFRLMPAVFLSGLLGAVWLVRMMLSSDVIYAGASNWQPISHLMADLLNGGPFAHQWVFISGLAVVGAVSLGLRAGRFEMFALLLPAVLMIAGSMDVLVGSDCGLLGGKLSLIQYRRFSIPVKPLWYALAGTGIATIGAGLVSRLGAASDRTARPIAMRCLLAACLAPFVWGFIHQAAPELIQTPVGYPLTLKRTNDQASVAAIGRVLEREKATPKRFYKAVYWEKPGHGGLYPVLAMANAGFAWHSTLHLPANNFKWLNPTTDIPTLARLGASIVISKWPHTHQQLQEIGKYGRHYVYRVLGNALAPVAIEGPGKVSVRVWEPEQRTVRVSGSTPDTSLAFFMPPYRKWHASQGGQTLELHRVRSGNLVLTEISNVRDGELVLSYRDSLLETVLSIIGILIVMACAVGLVLSPRPVPSFLPEDRRQSAYRYLAISLGLLVLCGAVLIAAGGRSAAEQEWISDGPRGTALLSVLHRQGPSKIAYTPQNYCVKSYVRNPDWTCAVQDLKPGLTAARRRQGKIPSCFAVGVPPEGRTRVVFDLPGKTNQIKGRFHLISKGVVTGHLDFGPIASGAKPIGTAGKSGTYFQTAVPSDAQQVTFEFSSQTKARICLEAVAISRPSP